MGPKPCSVRCSPTCPTRSSPRRTDRPTCGVSPPGPRYARSARYQSCIIWLYGSAQGKSLLLLPLLVLLQVFSLFFLHFFLAAGIPNLALIVWHVMWSRVQIPQLSKMSNKIDNLPQTRDRTSGAIPRPSALPDRHALVERWLNTHHQPRLQAYQRAKADFVELDQQMRELMNQACALRVVCMSLFFLPCSCLFGFEQTFFAGCRTPNVEWNVDSNRSLPAKKMVQTFSLKSPCLTLLGQKHFSIIHADEHPKSFQWPFHEVLLEHTSESFRMVWPDFRCALHF